MGTEKSIWAGISRGIQCRCPNCGKGRLFKGFLTPVRCDVCANDNAIYPSDDLPPYLTMLIVGHVIVGLLLWVNSVYALSISAELAIWLSAALLLSLALLRPTKGAAIGICWATGIVRDSIHQNAS